MYVTRVCIRVRGSYLVSGCIGKDGWELEPGSAYVCPAERLSNCISRSSAELGSACCNVHSIKLRELQRREGGWRKHLHLGQHQQVLQKNQAASCSATLRTTATSDWIEGRRLVSSSPAPPGQTQQLLHLVSTEFCMQEDLKAIGTGRAFNSRCAGKERET